jgi:hypothetical protein
VPDLVDAFIAAECADYAGMTDEASDACVAGERSGSRAPAMMLSDPRLGEMAAERYRACRAGLGMHGGRFHRRRAECIGGSFRYVWRFEETTRASLPERSLRADGSDDARSPARRQAFEAALPAPGAVRLHSPYAVRGG